MLEAQPVHLGDRADHENRLQLGKQIVVFIGPEGSGKTTMAKRLASNSQKPYITTGDILRDMAANDKTKYGDECRAMFKEHRYLNPNMLLNILVKRFSQDDVNDGFILDGGLRTVEEIRGFPLVLKKANRVMPLTVVSLRVPGWMGAQRLVFDKDARRRDDDTVDGVLSRLSNYYKNLGQRASLIEKQENWRLLRINATGTIDEAFNSVQEALMEKSK